MNLQILMILILKSYITLLPGEFLVGFDFRYAHIMLS
jgi:hypothetical protein